LALKLIISAGPAEVYPEQWGRSGNAGHNITDFESVVGGYLKTLNGNCGWGYTGDYVDPKIRPD
jgi:hypothetical protein